MKIQSYNVPMSTYHHYVQDSLSTCGTISETGDYLAPQPPADVLEAIAADKPGGKKYYESSMELKRFKKYTTGAYELTGNGLPTVIWRAKNFELVDVYIPYLDTTVKVRHYEYRYHAWVPGYEDNSCNEWVRLQYID